MNVTYGPHTQMLEPLKLMQHLAFDYALPLLLIALGAYALMNVVSPLGAREDAKTKDNP